MALGQTAGCPRVNRAKKFMCSPRNTGNINFSLWLTGGLSQGCPDFQKVYVFKVYVPFSCPINKNFKGLSRDYPGTVPGLSRPFPEISWEFCLCVSLFPQEKGKHINNLTPTHFQDNSAKLFMLIGFFAPDIMENKKPIKKNHIKEFCGGNALQNVPGINPGRPRDTRDV